MGRPPIEPGKHGAIATSQLARGTWKARTRVRSWDGTTYAYVSATGRTEREATARLIDKLADRQVTHTRDGNAVRTFAEVAADWLEDKRADPDIRPQTTAEYSRTLHNHVIPQLGAVPITKCDTREVQAALRRIKKNGGKDGRPVTGNQPRQVANAVFKWAFSMGEISVNPLYGTTAPKAKKPKKDPLTVERARGVIDAIRAWEEKKRPGPKVGPNLREVVTFLLGTGTRPGEVLAIRWRDVFLDADVPYAAITGNLAEPRGEDLRDMTRGAPKTDAGLRLVPLPPALVEMLHERRKRTIWRRQDDPVFISERTGEWLWQHNLARNLRDALHGTEYQGVTFRTFRKTAATAVTNSLGAQLAADLLGHGDSKITLAHYAEKALVLPEIGDVLYEFVEPAEDVDPDDEGEQSSG